jgi:hypothetical protein
MWRTLLCAMAWVASIMVGTPWLAKKSAEEYCSVRWLFSRMTCTWMPRLWASSSAFVMGAEVKEYAWTRIFVLASPKVLTMRSVQWPPGVKHTVILLAKSLRRTTQPPRRERVLTSPHAGLLPPSTRASRALTPVLRKVVWSFQGSFPAPQARLPDTSPGGRRSREPPRPPTAVSPAAAPLTAPDPPGPERS